LILTNGECFNYELSDRVTYLNKKVNPSRFRFCEAQIVAAKDYGTYRSRSCKGYEEPSSDLHPVRNP
jgi:hypothetical protein